MIPESIRRANAKYQRDYKGGLDSLGLCQCSLIIPKEYKKLVDVYAAKGGYKKKEAWVNVIKAGLNALSIS